MKRLSKNAQQIIVEAAARVLCRGKRNSNDDEPSFRAGILYLLQEIDDMDMELTGGHMSESVRTRAFELEKVRR